MTAVVDRHLARARALQSAMGNQTHEIGHITGLQDALDGKAPTSHSHSITSVSGLQAALDGKQAAGSYEVAGAAASAVAAHAAAANPHPTYLTQAEADLLYLAIGLGGGSDPWTWQKLALDSTVSTVALANVTGMSFTALPLTTYLVQVFGAYTAAATTTGIGLALDVPAGATVIGQTITSISATALGGTEQVADAASTGATASTRAVNTNAPITYWAVVSIGAVGGTVQLMQRSEIAASNTVLKAGLTIMGRRAIA